MGARRAALSLLAWRCAVAHAAGQSLQCEYLGRDETFYRCASQTQATARCQREGLLLCSKEEVSTKIGPVCAYMWTSSSSTHGYYLGSGSAGCGTSGQLHGSTSSYNGKGLFNAACCVQDDVTPPALELRGPALVTLNVGDIWEDPGCSCVDTIDGIRSKLPVGVADSPPVGIALRTARTYLVTYRCTDRAGNAAPPVQRTVQVLQAARFWRIAPDGPVGNATTFWEVQGIEFFSDPLCLQGIPVVPTRTGWQRPNGVSFSTPSGTTRRADGAFAVWKRPGTNAQHPGSGWSAGQPCQVGRPGCHVGFAFDHPVIVNCAKLRQGTAAGSFATDLRLQWRQEEYVPTSGGGWDGFYDLVKASGLSAGAEVYLRRPCPNECAGCSEDPSAPRSCAVYSPRV